MALEGEQERKRLEPFPFDRIASLRIHPGIGIARLGNSEHEFFFAPEAPVDPREIVPPKGGYKDADGRIKRQGARFRIYAYDDKGVNLGELPLESEDSGQQGYPAAKVTWTVHLANKKGAWYQVRSRYRQDGAIPVRNAFVRVPPGEAPDARRRLVIDPGARTITGMGAPAADGSLAFESGEFLETKVPLGELKVDRRGRLIVLGGRGRSASIKQGNPIGADPADPYFWANNDYWYDDTSDGPVTADVTLPGQAMKSMKVDDARVASWVVVAPPNYAPGIYPLVTLYDVVRDVAVRKGWREDPVRVTYYGDIYPILRRAADTAWVNDEARRGHGFDKRDDFTTPRGGVQPPEPQKRTRVTNSRVESERLAQRDGTETDRARIFERIRDPKPVTREVVRCKQPDPVKHAKAIEQASYKYMPPLSGDDGDRTPGRPGTWLTVLPSQYEKLEHWKNGDFDPGNRPRYPPLGEIPLEEVAEALDRAALEPCVGGAFYPGIEVSWRVAYEDLYADAYRVDSARYKAGDLTKYMCVPWQADFYECKEGWWPAARPDDVVPEEVFIEATKAWRRGQPPLSEALEGRVKWDRGLGVTTLFRRPWQNPAEAVDDPRDTGRRGCDDMVRYWHELGFVVPCRTVWDGPDQPEYVHVERDRRPHAGMDVRELFNCLLNLDENPTCLPKVEAFVSQVLEAARQLQQSADAFAWMDNIRPFRYDEDVFKNRMAEIYDDCVDIAFSEKVDGVRVEYDPKDPRQNPYFRTKEAVTERIRQLTPFNFLDGAWLRNIHRVGPVDEVNSILFMILKEELGDGVVAMNHANIYRDLCHSFGYYPPPIESTAFAYDPAYLDCAFDSPAFQLGISQFSRRYYPEIMGMSLWLEWTALDLHRIARIVENVQLDPYFYRMHITIDNCAAGHGAGIVRAVKMYLQEVRNNGGEQAVQDHWRRIWDGYVAFAYTFVIIVRQVTRIVQEPPTLEARLRRMIRAKAAFGQQNHQRIEFGGESINALFDNPGALMKGLVDFGYIVPGQPDKSRFFEALKPEGRMYRVFTNDEIRLWRDWTLKLGTPRGDPKRQRVQPLRDRLVLIDSAVATRITDDEIGLWQRAARDHRIALWLEVAVAEHKREHPKVRPDAQAIKRAMQKRFEDWLGWSMIRGLTYIAAAYAEVAVDIQGTLEDPRTGRQRKIPEWFELIAAAPNPAPLARDMLWALKNALANRRDAVEATWQNGTPLRYALGKGVPGNDGHETWTMLESWRAADCPLPSDKELPKSVRSLHLDSSLDDEERHPTGIAMGFCTVH